MVQHGQRVYTTHVIFVLKDKGETIPRSYFYGPIVLGGLVTHGHQSNEIDEDSFGGEAPLRQSTEMATGLDRLRMCGGGDRKFPR